MDAHHSHQIGAEVIERFVSPIGRSDVPYPVLVTNTSVYILVERTVLPRARFPAWDTDVLWEGANRHFYDGGDEGSQPLSGYQELEPRVM